MLASVCFSLKHFTLLTGLDPSADNRQNGAGRQLRLSHGENNEQECRETEELKMKLHLIDPLGEICPILTIHRF